MGAPYEGDSTSANEPGLKGTNTTNGDGTWGVSNAGRGVVGISDGNVGVEGGSKSGVGTFGISSTGRGVVGVSTSATGVEGNSTSGVGVWGESAQSEGIHAETKSTTTAAMAAYQMNAASGTAAFFAKHVENKTAGRFEGDVEVTGSFHSGHVTCGDINGATVNCSDVVLSNADCAEDFDVVGIDTIEPGTVMVIDHEGALQQSHQAYDKKVAWVISGACEYRHRIILDKQQQRENRMPVALLGKVYCKVDAKYSPVDVRDLLTTSPTPGHAMKAGEPLTAFGAVIGKALRPLREGKGLIPILIALQ